MFLIDAAAASCALTPTELGGGIAVDAVGRFQKLKIFRCRMTSAGPVTKLPHAATPDRSKCPLRQLQNCAQSGPRSARQAFRYSACSPFARRIFCPVSYDPCDRNADTYDMRKQCVADLPPCGLGEGRRPAIRQDDPVHEQIEQKSIANTRPDGMVVDAWKPDRHCQEGRDHHSHNGIMDCKASDNASQCCVIHPVTKRACCNALDNRDRWHA